MSAPSFDELYEKARISTPVLNPKFWSGMNMRTEVREKLLGIAKDFVDGLKMSSLKLEDIVLTGSSANFNWHPGSDLDLHMLVDLRKVHDCDPDITREYFADEGLIWNEHHMIFIRGHEVEVYIQDISDPHYATGVFSVQKNKWLQKPEVVKDTPDPSAVRPKSDRMKSRIDRALGLAQANPKRGYNALQKMRDKIRNMRKTALATDGEHAVENLVFKKLRRDGYLDKLRLGARSTYDQLMSLSEHTLAEELGVTIAEMEGWSGST
jgi:hypothetical protein